MIKRICVKVGTNIKNFLTIKEISHGGVEIIFRGMSHQLPVNSNKGNIDFNSTDGGQIVYKCITVHPNQESKIDTVGIHYKFQQHKKPIRSDFYAYIVNVKKGDKLFPIWTSMGRNVGRPSLNVSEKHLKDEFVELWKDGGLDLSRDSLCYSIFICNPSIRFLFPKEFPRNTLIFKYKHFQLILVYWLFNQPTKYRGIDYFETTNPKGLASDGRLFHQMLNFTNDITLFYLELYNNLPSLK